jgi:hypothetical protein
MRIPISVNNRSVILTEDRWRLLSEAHPEIARMREEIYNAIEDPDTVLAGPRSHLIAVRELEPKRHMVVLYIEKGESEGTIATAYLTKDTEQFDELRTIWKKIT